MEEGGVIGGGGVSSNNVLRVHSFQIQRYSLYGRTDTLAISTRLVILIIYVAVLTMISIIFHAQYLYVASYYFKCNMFSYMQKYPHTYICT